VAETGKVRWFKNGYGRASRADGTEAFLPPGTFPRGTDIVTGDELEFDAEPDPDPARAGQFLAKNVRIVNKAPRAIPAPAPRLATTTPLRTAPSPPQGLAIEIRTKGSAIIQQTVGAKKKEERVSLPVWVEVTRDGVPVVSEEVALDADGHPAVQFVEKVFTGKTGLAFFHVILPAGKTKCHLIAHVDGKSYSAYWDKESEDAEAQQAQTLITTPGTSNTKAETPKVAKVIKVLETGTNNEGFTTFEVLTLTEDGPNAEGVQAEYTFVSSAELELEAVVFGSISIGHSIGYRTGKDGQSILPIRPSKPGEASVYFRLTQFPAKVAGPFKITRKEEAKSADQVVASTLAAEPKEPPKVAKISMSEGVYKFQVSGAVVNSELSVEAPFGVQFRKTALPADVWSTDKLLIGPDGNLTLELAVTTERARGIIRFRIGQFVSDKFYVVHPLPSLPAAKPQVTN